MVRRDNKDCGKELELFKRSRNHRIRLDCLNYVHLSNKNMQGGRFCSFFCAKYSNS